VTPQAGSETRGIDVPRVSRFLLERIPGAAPPLRYQLIAGGRSNLTYRVRSGEASWVLRRPPLGHVLPTAHDMAREYRVLSALADTAVPVPRPLVLCEEPEVNGAPFYVMEYAPGVVVEEGLPDGYARSCRERRALSRALVDTLVALHAVDVEAVGLGDFGRPRGYLERQVRRWSQQWERSATGPLPAIEELIRRLKAALPASPRASLVHGDYRLGNLALDPADPGRVIAIFDWEMATLGDPLADLGYTLMYWGEEGEPERDACPLPHAAVTARPGFLTRAELVEAYAQRSGRDVEAIDFYCVLALTKSAVIAEGIYARFLQGQTLGPGFEGMTRHTGRLAERALAIADASPLRGLRG
jgi:aminoglycoside phosphotransferase (APT) family kinase protein